MRPREIDSSPTPSSPPPSRATGNLSSMVVRPTDDSTGGGYRGYNPDEFERRVSSPTPRRRGFQRISPTGFRRHSPTASPAYRPYRSGNLPHAGSISPPARRPRMNGSRGQYDGEYNPHYSHGYGGGRGRGRFRNMSPPRVSSGFGRANGGRFYGREYELDRRQKSPFEDDEFDGRNDPNVSPREGDWICVNPRCGNLNFARRSYCNNCDQPRIAAAVPPPWRSPPPPPPPRRSFTAYNNTTRGEGKFNEYTYYRGGRRGGRSGGHFDKYDRREPSPPFPRDRWVRRRSRSPTGDFRGTSSSSYRGGGRGGGRGFRPYDDDHSFGGGGGGRGASSRVSMSPPPLRKHSHY